MTASNGTGQVTLYLRLAACVIASWVAVWLLPVSSIMKDLASIPGAFALIGAVFQLLRDQASREQQLLRDEAEHTRKVLREEAAHDRQLSRDEAARDHERELERSREAFSIGATSHMARIVFDHHVAFCDEYMNEMHNTITVLWRNGPCKEALENCANLSAIRRKHVVWITSDIMSKLEPFETALRQIGSAAVYIEQTRLSGDENRSKMIELMMSTFTNVLGERVVDKEVDQDKNTDLVMAKLRAVLGIEELTQMRVSLVKKALGASE